MQKKNTFVLFSRMYSTLAVTVACLPWALSVKCENISNSMQARNASRISRGSCKKIIKKEMSLAINKRFLMYD